MKKHQFICLLWLLSPLYGQNLVNLQTQTKNVDFSSAITTKPAKSGTALPATCSPGEMFFNTANPAGQNLYGCTSVNTWTVQTGNGSGTVAVGTAGQFGYYSANGTAIGGHTLAPGDIPALSYQAPLTFTGNGAKTTSSTGAATANDCAKWDANGNIIDAGAACGTVGAGIMGQFGYYAANGAAISGRAIQATDIPTLNYQMPLTFTGTGTKTASSTGTSTANDCAKWDASGNIVDAGAACGAGGSTNGTVGSGLTGQFGYYSANGPAIGGRTLLPSDIPALNYQAALNFTGTGSKTASSTGTVTAADCAAWDAHGNIVDAGAPCGSGSGGNMPAQIGTASILVSNGTTASWGNIPTGGSGALDCATNPGVCDIVTAVVPLKASANVWTGANDFSGASFLRLTNGTGVPSTGCTVLSNVGGIYVRSDALAVNSSLYLCSQTGPGVFAWELAQGAAGGSGGGAISTGYSNPVFGTSGYQSSMQIVAVNGAKTVQSFAFVLQAAAVFNAFNFAVGTAATSNCGAGTTGCGYAMQITDPTGTNSLCVAADGLGGSGTTSDINSIGPKSAAASFGLDYAGGFCTLPAGSYLFQEASDSTSLAVVTTGLSASEAIMSINHPIKGGFSPAATAAGSGASLAIGNTSGVTFTPFANALTTGHLPLIVLENK